MYQNLEIPQQSEIMTTIHKCVRHQHLTCSAHVKTPSGGMSGHSLQPTGWGALHEHRPHENSQNPSSIIHSRSHLPNATFSHSTCFIVHILGKSPRPGYQHKQVENWSGAKMSNWCSFLTEGCQALLPGFEWAWVTWTRRVQHTLWCSPCSWGSFSHKKERRHNVDSLNNSHQETDRQGYPLLSSLVAATVAISNLPFAFS